MGSFYGNGVICGGTSTTTDYNGLTNIPIINLHGISPLDLSILKVGLYKISGNYCYKPGAETITFSEPHFVQVFSDITSNAKIIRFDFYENKIRYTKTIKYFDDTYEVEINTYGNLVVAGPSDLPPIGDPSKLYHTKEGIYVWTGDDYQKLGSTADPSWGSF